MIYKQFLILKLIYTKMYIQHVLIDEQEGKNKVNYKGSKVLKIIWF